MAFMFSDLSGVIRISNYTPTTAIQLGKGKEAALIEARAYLGQDEFVNGETRYVVPGVADLPSASTNEGYFERVRAINDFRKRVEAFLKGGAA